MSAYGNHVGSYHDDRAHANGYVTDHADRVDDYYVRRNVHLLEKQDKKLMKIPNFWVVSGRVCTSASHGFNGWSIQMFKVFAKRFISGF